MLASDVESVASDVESDATDVESIGIHTSLAGGRIREIPSFRRSVPLTFVVLLDGVCGVGDGGGICGHRDGTGDGIDCKIEGLPEPHLRHKLGMLTLLHDALSISNPTNGIRAYGSKVQRFGETRTLLSLDKNEEVGGMRISTAVPYTLLEPSIYDVVSKSSVSEMPKEVKMVPAVQPFKTCFDSTYIGMSRLGYNAPKIDIVLHKPNVYWTITGANSLVKVSEKVICLPFVERNQTFGQAIAIGGYQMQDILVEFDLARSRIGYSNSLYFRQTTCSNQFYT
ncbi:hypothetical protein T459_00897 [Capsicum annuum]|uniref:Xylanase inhibitor C-terminal domain-containing protein n=1 Tax=Capsicum annuum TaxID=4072 RepID=A0A2G3AFK7_CAPAN|nr:hypothetical protein T459_00897 [Capsicum annuum]